MAYPPKSNSIFNKPWVTIPVFLTIITLIVARFIKIFYTEFSILPLVIIGYLCSLSTTYLTKGFYGKKTQQIQKTQSEVKEKTTGLEKETAAIKEIAAVYVEKKKYRNKGKTYRDSL